MKVYTVEYWDWEAHGTMDVFVDEAEAEKVRDDLITDPLSGHKSGEFTVEEYDLHQTFEEWKASFVVFRTNV